MIRAAALAIALCLAASPAGAQDAPVTTAPPVTPPPADFDPIAAVLADPGAYSTDVDDEEPAPAAPAPAPYSPPPVAVAPPPLTLPPLVPPMAARRKLDRPVLIDEAGLTPEGPLAPQEVGYDMRIRANIADAQGRQGPLDGGWTVTGEGGAKLYSLQLVDPSNGNLEGAWRSLQRHGLGTTGLISSLERGAASLTVRFSRGGTENPTVIILEGKIDGSWSGQMWEDGKVLPVSMRR